MAMKEKVYAIYKGDTYITAGTKREIAKDLGWKIESVRRMCAPSWFKTKKDSNKAMVAYPLEDDQ